MKITKNAVAGTLESSDAMVTVEPNAEGAGIEFDLDSVVINQFGNSIRRTVMDTLKRLDVQDVKISIVDKGALDCTLKARVEGALFRADRKSSMGRCDSMSNPNKKRLRRTMMFLNCQKPGLIKDPYIYKPDSIMLDLEDAVAEKEKDAARYSLFHALREIDYRGVERVVRINGLDTPYWREDIRCAVAGGCDAIRIPKTESAQDVHVVEEAVIAAEKEFGREAGSVLIMAALESARGIMKALDICEASDRLFGIALSGGDYTKDLQTHITGTGIELMGARQNMVIAARAAGVQCFDTVYTDLDNMDGFRKDVEAIHLMGFDGKSIINPRQIEIVHDIYTPKQKDIIFAEKVVKEIDDKKAKGIGVFTVDGKMIDIAFYDGAKRTIELAKASGVYEGDL